MRQLLLGVGLVVAFGAPGFAQQNFSELRGRVTDPQGAALPGVTIVIRNQDSGLFRETVSGAEGSYFITAMNPGVYEVSAELPGFRRFQQRDVRLEVGRTASLDIPLAIGAIEESVTVTGESPIVDLSSKEIGGNVAARELAETPAFNRNFTAYLGMLPGVVASISTGSFGADSINVNGQTVRNVNYTLDGANNNDTFNGGNGGAQARLPVDAVQEFQLLTSQFDAEFGSTSGGVVNAVSKQGTNQLRGSAFFFFQNDAMAQRDYFARTLELEKPDTKQRQWGGTLGGPVVKDKAHFFLSLERIEFDNGFTVNVPVRPDLNRTDFEKTRVWNWLARFDNQLNANHTWGVRMLWESSPQDNQVNDPPGYTPSRLEKETDVDWTLVGTMNSVIGSTKVNTLRLSAVREDVFFGNPQYFDAGRQDTLQPTLDYLSFEDQQSPRATSRLDMAYGLDDTFAWFVPNKFGDHDLKFGAQYLYSWVRRFVATNQNGTFQFAHDLPFNPADPRSYPDVFTIRVPGAQDFLAQAHFVSGFAQDKWKVANRLNLSLGVRYDLEIQPINEVNNPRFSDPGNYPLDGNNVAPRLGFTYAVDEGSRSVVRGGFGLFYQKTPFTFTDSFVSSGVIADSFLARFPTSGTDPGPSRGELPTNPALATFPRLNRALIDSLFPPGTTQRNAGDVFFDNPDRKLPYARQYSIGYERAVRNDMSVSLDYIRSEQRDLYMRRNLNPGLRTTTSRTSPLVRPDPNFVQNVWEIGNYGFIDYNALQLEVNKRYSRGFALRGSYTYSRGRGNNDVGNNEVIENQLSNDLRLDLQEGPTSIDRPHVLSINGSYDVPKTGGLVVGGTYQYRSGTPFSLIDSNLDPDRNGRFSNDYLPAGTYSGVGPDAITVDYDGGRRGARGPDYIILNLRGTYRFRLPQGRRLEVFADVFNATNRTNFGNPTAAVDTIQVADRRSPNFLLLRAIDEYPRTLQLNVRYVF